MKIIAHYSHLNGLEYLLVHQPTIWNEIKNIIGTVNGDACKTKISNEKTKKGKLLYSPKDMNAAMKNGFESHAWEESRVSYWVTQNANLIRKTMHMAAKEQKAEIEKIGERAIFSYNQTDFVKNRVAVEVQFGKYSFVAFDLFVKHLAFYVRDVIDVGVEILPMKVLQSERASRKTSFASFSRYPAGLVYWGKGYKSMTYVTGNHVPSPKPPSH